MVSPSPSLSLLLSSLALRELDRDIRQEYETALEVFPELVRQETKILDFLRTDDFDVPKAAHRLAMYWKYRKQIFKERWLLPMRQTGTGALNMEDIEFLRTGYMVCWDVPGRGLQVVYDHSRLKHFHIHTHMRIAMYIMTMFTEPISQSLGGGCVFVVHSGRRPPSDMSRQAWEMYRLAMPCKFPRQVIVAQAFEVDKSGLIDFLAFQEQRTAQFRSQLPSHMLVADSSQGMMSKLQARGMARYFIPQCLGGDYRYEQQLVLLSQR